MKAFVLFVSLFLGACGAPIVESEYRISEPPVPTKSDMEYTGDTALMNWEDPQTGCFYVVYLRGGITIRYDTYGQPLCPRSSQMAQDSQ